GFSPISQRLKGAASFKLHSVVSLYDYAANRSDELTIRRGDVIQVLYKDNDTWWFGRLVNGLQGYFLASYVVDQREFIEESAEQDQASLEKTVERSTPTRVSAAVSSSGELRFLSEPTFSDTEPELANAKLKEQSTVFIANSDKVASMKPSPELSLNTSQTKELCSYQDSCHIVWEDFCRHGKSGGHGSSKTHSVDRPHYKAQANEGGPCRNPIE
ncbi:hypothetical protein GOODEAATRI_006156, partial [Goodea atripinnis]